MTNERDKRPRDPNALEVDRWGTTVVYNPATGAVTLVNAVEGVNATLSRDEFDAVTRFVRKRKAATQ